jgi:putative ABC transport system permease protein
VGEASRSGLGHRIAQRLIRGPDAAYIVADVRESMERDIARGVPRWRARLRQLRNLAGSATSTWVAQSSGEWRLFSWLDVKLGLRLLWKHPLLAAASVITLAVGIPVGVAPAHVAEAIDAELPVVEGERVRALRFRPVATGGDPATRVYDFLVWRDALASFGSLAALHLAEHAVDPGTGIPVLAKAAHVTGDGFGILGTAPLLGRTLQPSDMEADAPTVVVIGHGLWQARFGGDPAALGRAVRVAGVLHTVVGIMPDGFRFPFDEELWLPLRLNASAQPGEGPSIVTFGRLADGIIETQANAEAEAVHARLRAADPERYERIRTEVVSMPALLLGLPRDGLRSGLAMRVLDIAGLMVLALACVNVGILVFARTAARASDMAVRTALGASRVRIVWQVCMETFVLSLLATGVGLLVWGALANALWTTILPPRFGALPWWMDLSLTPITIVRALVLAVVASVLSAIVPALRVTGRGVQRNMREAEARRSGIRFGGLSSVLIAADVAVAVGALGLVVAASERLRDTEAGRGLRAASTDRYLAAQVRLPEPGQPGQGPAVTGDERVQRRAALQRELVARLVADPAVRAVAVGSRLPRMQHARIDIEVEDRSRGDTLVTERVFSTFVARGFFAAFGAPILAGRDFLEPERTVESTAVLVNVSFRDRVLGGQNPVGRRIRYVAAQGNEPGPWREIVGVVPDLGVNIFQPVESEALYRPVAPGQLDVFWVAVDVGADPAAYAPRLRAHAGDVDAEALVDEVGPLSSFYPDDHYMVWGTRLGLILLVTVLLAMSGSGIYAITSFAVAQRTREIGIRTALGAPRRHIAATVGRRAAGQLGAGVLLGTPLAIWLYLLVEVDPHAGHFGWIAAAVPGLIVLLLLGAAACGAPLARALRIPPNEALRNG